MPTTNQFDWSWGEAGEGRAWQFFHSVDATVFKLARQPDLGGVRRFRASSLQGLRAFRVEPPFNKLLIFYRTTETSLIVWRLMHGARDLPRRLTEPPE